MSKRLREETLKGTPFKGDELFADKQRLLLILEKSDYKTLSAFELTSRRAREFVQERQVWRTLFQRVYSDVYRNAVEPGTQRMKQDIKAKIDEYTVMHRKGREETYWKRYYEFLVKTIDDMDERHRTTILYPSNWTTQYGDYHGMPALWDDLHVNGIGNRWKMVRKDKTNIVYYGMFGEDANDHVDHVIRIDTNNSVASIVPWFTELHTYKPVEYDVGSYAFQSIDGFYWCVMTYDLVYYKITPPKNLLVSQSLDCSICKTTTKQLHYCECCGEVYCGRECQKVNH